ncbi:MAG: hypothetical protein ACOZNI_33025 [Myxococcota bacterium]
MSESKPIISPENLPTVASVAVILSLLSIAYGVYLHREIMYATVGLLGVDARAAKLDEGRAKDLADLKTRIEALEAKLNAQAAAPADATAGAAAEAPAAPPQ